MKDKKKIIGALIGACAVLYLYIFLLFYVPNYMIEVQGDVSIYLIVREFSERLVYFAAPLISAAGLFALYGGERFLPSLLGASLLSLSTLVYSIPYTYLYLLSLGYDSLDALLPMLLLSFAAYVIDFIHVSLLHIAMRSAAKIMLGAGMKRELPPKRRERLSKEDASAIRKNLDTALPNALSVGEAFDFSAEATVGIFAGAALEFVYRLVLELIDTVSYISVGGVSDFIDVLYIAFTYTIILGELVLMQFICHKIKKLITERALDKPSL